MFSNIQQKFGKNKGISTTIGYAATLSITVILLGILVGVFSVQMNTQIDNAKEQELQIAGSQLATEIEKVDATVKASSVNSISVEPQFSKTAGNEDYRIYAEDTSQSNIYELHLETPEGITHTSKFRSQTPIDTDGFANSTKLQITYDSSENHITFINTQTINRVSPTNVGPVQNISGNYTIPDNHEDPPTVASGNINGGDGSSVNGKLISGGQIDTAQGLKIYGNVESQNGLNFDKFTYASGNVDSGGSTQIREESIIGGSLTSDSNIQLGKSTSVGGDVVADTDIQLGEYTNISGTVDGREIDIRRNTKVVGDVVGSTKVTIRNFSEVQGTVDSGTQVEIRQGAFVNESVTAQSRVEMYEGSDVGSITTDGDVITGVDSEVRGSVTSNSGIIDLGKKTTVTEDVIASSRSSITCGSNVTINGKDCSQYLNDNY